MSPTPIPNTTCDRLGPFAQIMTAATTQESQSHQTVDDEDNDEISLGEDPPGGTASHQHTVLAY